MKILENVKLLNGKAKLIHIHGLNYQFVADHQSGLSIVRFLGNELAARNKFELFVAIFGAVHSKTIVRIHKLEKDL